MNHAGVWPAVALVGIAAAACTSGEEELADPADEAVVDAEERAEALEAAADSSGGGAAREAARDGAAAAARGPAAEPRGQAAAAAARAAAAAPLGETSVQESARAYLTRRPGEPVDGPGEMDPDAVGAIAVCAVCHGMEGEGHAALNAPRIGGMAEWYLARQLKYFKNGIRAGAVSDVYGTQMRAVALTLEDQAAIEDLAAYFATLDPPPAPALTSGDAERGKELYAVCAACHGEDGRGSPDLNTPSMILQDGGYLVRQLENFRSGVRGSHPTDIFGQQMRPIVQTTLMSREDIVDVVSYIATLR